MKKALSILLAFVFLFSCCVTVFAVDGENGEIIILYTNDVHCAIDDYALLAGYRAQLISEGNTVITVDAGDAIQGEIIGTLTEGSAIVKIMNAVGYDYAAIGNHEFDYTVETFLELTASAEYEYLCTNFRDLVNDVDLFAPYAIKEANGKKLAFVGIATPETYSKSTPTYFQDENGIFIYSFLEDVFYESVQNAVDSAIENGADTVIAVGHLGIEGTTEKWSSVSVLANTSGIDAFIDAHSHEIIPSSVYKNADSEDVLLTSTGTKLANIGKLTVSDDGITTELISTDDIDVTLFSESAKAEYDKLKTITDGYNDEISYLFEPIGTSETTLTITDENGNRLIRKSETNMGNFVPDAYRAVTGADIAFVNGGGVRASLAQGDVTRKALMDVNPWNNEMCVIEITGAQLVDALEYGMHATPTEFGSFPHTSGLEFELHLYVDSPVTVDDYDNCVSIDEDLPRRVRNVRVNGVPVDHDKTYTLAGTSYMLQLSGYTMFNGARVAEQCTLSDAEMLIEYFVDHLNGVITAEQYGASAGDGRIFVIDNAYIMGDTDGSGSIDGIDYLLVKRDYFDTYTLSAAEQVRADVNQSGTIDEIDYVLIKRIYFGTYSD